MLEELRPALLGRRLSGPRPLGLDALVWELPGRRRLVLDAGRDCAGLYLLTQGEAAAVGMLRTAEPGGQARQALLLFRKHTGGVRVGGVRRVPGERHLIVESAEATLSLRLWGSPALTLAVAGRPLATLGTGRAAWPPPEPREEDRLYQPETLRSAGPTLWLPAPLAELDDAELARPEAVRVSSEPGAPNATLHPSTWREAFALLLELRARGEAFAARRRERLQDARRELKRLRSLERHLAQDACQLAEPDALRRQAEALLAAPASAAGGASEAAVPDPYEPGRTLRVRLDPALDAVRNAERLFATARRIERGRSQISTRLLATRAQCAAAEERLATIEKARRIADLEGGGAAPPRRGGLRAADSNGGRRHYLTSRGLSLYVGRGAKENQRLTFGLARPEDLWFHARDAPGAHVILRDEQARAGMEDRREAAEVAAFFSHKAGDTAVDVHCARRKHLRAAKGGHGRVTVGHSETLRVTPKDPEGRLRRRP